MEKKDTERKGAGRKDTGRKGTGRKSTGRRTAGEKGKTGTNAEQDQDTSIAYQNKDIVSKLFGDRMKGKPLSLFGLESDLKVVDARPTNIPIVRARELRMDNLFELEDGSAAIFDYESEYRELKGREIAGYPYDGIVHGRCGESCPVDGADSLHHTDGSGFPDGNPF